MWRPIWIIVAVCLVSVFADQGADFDDDLVSVEDHVPEGEGMDSIPGLNGKQPTEEELINMLDKFQGLSDEDKAKLRESLAGKVHLPMEEETKPAAGFLYQTMILLSLLSLISCIFLFFGYKLYKSLVDRELRREMKRKQKELKKKK